MRPPGREERRTDFSLYSGECSEEGDAYVAAAGRGNGAFDAWRGGRVGGVVIAALALVMGVLL